MLSFPRISGNSETSGYYAVTLYRPSSYFLFVELQSKMAVTLQGFDEAVTYALRAVGKEHMVLKTEQLQAIHHIYDGKDVFLWLPTGFGKSICYETLPFVFDFKLERVSGTASSSVVIVVSPLVSLMADQVASLRKRGVKAAILSGHGSVAKELQVTDKELRSCDFSLLFSSPEAIASARASWRNAMIQSTCCCRP